MVFGKRRLFEEKNLQQFRVHSEQTFTRILYSAIEFIPLYHVTSTYKLVQQINRYLA